MPSFIFHTANGSKKVNVPRWAMIMVGLGVAAVGVLLLLLAASLALIIVPVTVMGVALAGWYARRQLKKAGRNMPDFNSHASTRRKPTKPDVIEAEYVVVDKREDSK